MVAVLAGFLLVSCTKKISQNNNITGKWEVRKSVGGFAGTIQYEPGQGPLYEFDTNEKFRVSRIFTPGGSGLSGSYALKSSRRPGDWLLELSYLNAQTGHIDITTDSIRFEKNQLIFLPQASCCDIPTTFLERVVL